MPSRRRVLGTLGLGVAGLAGCTGNVTNGRFGGGSNDGADRRRWSTKLVSDIGTVDLTVTDGSVYVSTTETLFALDRKTGDVRWRVGGTKKNGDDRRPHFTKPAVHAGTVYVGTWDGRGLLALDAADGSEQWRYVPSGSDDPRIVVPPRPMYNWSSLGVADGGGNVSCLSLDSQKPTWQFEVFGEPSVVSSRTATYVGTTAGEVYAISDGDGLWRRKLPGRILDLRADASTFGGGVFALQQGAFAGATRWRAEQGPVAHALVTTDESKTIYGGDMARLTALNRRTGAVRWTLDGDYHGGLAFGDDTLYAGREGNSSPSRRTAAAG